MSEETKLILQKLRQNLLDQLEKARGAIEELSDEQLESIVGGIRFGNMPMSPVGESLPPRS